MTAEKARPPLPIVFGPVLEKNVEQLKILNTAIFPVRYKVRDGLSALPPFEVHLPASPAAL